MTDDQPARTAEPSTIPDAPPAHTPAGSPPTPPSWSYRAGEGSPRVGPNRVADAPARAAPVRSASISMGPAGRQRSPFAVAVLSVVTLGVYALVWHKRINNEMSDFDPRMRVSAAASALAVTLAWLLGLIVTLAGAVRILLDVFKVTLPFDPHFSVTQAYFLLGGLVAVPYLILVLPFAVVAVAMTLERVRVVQDRVGAAADSQIQPAHSLWWLIVPVIGGLAMLASMQRALNSAWRQASSRASG